MNPPSTKSVCCDKCNRILAPESSWCDNPSCECHQFPPSGDGWESEFRKTFAEYASHQRLNKPAFIDWATEFIREKIAQARQAERKRIGEIIMGMKTRTLKMNGRDVSYVLDEVINKVLSDIEKIVE